jgi:predicted nucleic acid-binding protein
MNTVFVDANVFLRFFTHDDQGHHEKATTVLGRAAVGELALVAGPPVLFEIAWVLRTAYGQSREKILDVLSAIVAMPGLRLLDGDTAEDAVDRARQADTDFADAYIAAAAVRAGADQVATFSRRPFEHLGAALMDL